MTSIIAIHYVHLTLGSKKGLAGMSEMAMQYLPSSAPACSASDEDRGVELEATAYLNMATCRLKLKDPRNALELANKSLALKPGNWKGIKSSILADDQISISISSLWTAVEYSV
jgi:hypothetical protein